MLTRLLLIALFIICSCSQVNASDPVLFFSDLDSGPATGNGDTSLGQTANVNGAIVTIYGKNIGTSQGESTLTAGGVTATYIYDWGNVPSLEKTGGTYNRSLYDSHDMQYVRFQVPSTADSSGITVTVGGVTSNTIPFTVRVGNIYFVDDSASGAGTGSYSDPWQSPASYIDQLETGENGATCYFREGVYANTEYANTIAENLVLFYLSSNHAGITGNPNAFVGYPGEIASFEATYGDDKTDPGYYLGVSKDYPYNSAKYLTWSNLRLEGNTSTVMPWDGWRVVGCLHIAGTVHNSGSGVMNYGQHGLTVETQDRYPDGAKIYGNVITGYTTGDKLDHGFYVSTSNNLDLGWNLFYDLDIDVGPVVSINSKDAIELGSLTVGPTLIHDNVIDTLDHPARPFVVYESQVGSTYTFYNNVVLAAANWGSDALNVAVSGAGKIYNNTFYITGTTTTGPVFEFATHAGNDTELYVPDSIDFKNNIVYVGSETYLGDYISFEDHVSMPTPIIDSNLWYGKGTYVGNSSGTLAAVATNNVEADPLFVDLVEYDLHVTENSPALDTGTSSVSSLILSDFDGVEISSSYPIGAFSIFSTSQQPGSAYYFPWKIQQ